MIITTAKQTDRALHLAPLAVAALLLSAQCWAGTKFTPFISLSETYSDNPGLQPDGREQGQFISEAMPGFTLLSSTSRLRLNASAQWNYYAYQNGNVPNMRDRDRIYSASMDAKLIENLLSLEAGMHGSSQYVSAFGPQFGNLYSDLNRTEIRTWRISPILTHRFGSNAALRVQLTRDSVESDARATAFGNSHSTMGIANLSGTSAGAKLGWGLQYMHQQLDTDQFGSTLTKNALANLSYRLSREWAATATAGYDDNEYQALRNRTAGRSYSAGFIWTPSQRTSIDAAFGHNYLGKTGHLLAVQRNRRMVSQLSYTDLVTTTRQQFMLPATIDTAAMLDRLFSSSIADPAARALAVQAYIAATGLPLTLADPINYLSNRYLRDRRLQFAYIYNMPHSNLALSVYKSERNALSLQQSDSELLGNQFSSLNDNVRQRGANLNFSYRLSSRMTGHANLSAARSTSITTGLVAPSHFASVGLARQFDRQTSGALELRHVHTGSGFVNGTGDRTENAITATLSVKL